MYFLNVLPCQIEIVDTKLGIKTTRPMILKEISSFMENNFLTQISIANNLPIKYNSHEYLHKFQGVTNIIKFANKSKKMEDLTIDTDHTTYYNLVAK